MFNLSNLLGKSPFAPLKDHLNKVCKCIDELPSLFLAMESKDLDLIQKITKKISKLEHEADLTKNDIRNHLPRSLLLPIHRQDFLDILSLQDRFADRAEEIAILATIRKLDNYNEFKEDLEFFYKENISAFYLAKNVMNDFDNLLESSFGGIEAEKVKLMIEELSFKEHELDIAQYTLLKKIYDHTDKMPYSLFYIWITLLKEIGKLSNIAEKLGNRITMILETR